MRYGSMTSTGSGYLLSFHHSILLWLKNAYTLPRIYAIGNLLFNGIRNVFKPVVSF